MFDSPTTHEKSPETRPNRRRSKESRAAILRATTEVLHEVGYQRLTVDAVATRAHAGKTTVYRWWPTKANLIIDALGESLVLPEPELTGDSRADVRVVVQRVIDSVTETMFGSIIPALAVDLADDRTGSEQLTTMLGPQRAASFAVLLAAAGREDLPHDIDTVVILDLITGCVLYRHLMGRPVDDTLADQLTDLLLKNQLPHTSI